MPRRTSRRNIRLLAIFNFLLDFRLYAPVMVIYFDTVTHSYALAMSVLSLTMLSSALLEVPTGIFSDRIGRKMTIVLGAVSSLAAVTCYAIGGTYTVLLIGAFFEGMERALFSGNNDALLHDTLAETNEQHDYQSHLGRVSSMFQFALAASAVIGSGLAAISFALVMWLSVVPKVIMVGVSLRFVEPEIHSEQSGNVFGHLRDALRHIIHNPRLRMLSIGQIIGFGMGEAAFQFRVVFIEMLWPLWAIGLARVIAHMGAAVSYFFAGRLLKRFGEWRLLFVGMSLSELTNLSALLLNSVVSPVMMGATSIFFGVNNVSLGGMMQREFTDAQRSTMGSLTAFGGSLFFAVMSVALGWLADTIGIREALIVVNLFLFMPLIFFWLAFRRDSTKIPVPNTAYVEAD
jgi:MFS family permease